MKLPKTLYCVDRGSIKKIKIEEDASVYVHFIKDGNYKFSDLDTIFETKEEARNYAIEELRQREKEIERQIEKL